MRMHESIKAGALVQVFDRPITCEQLEGIAKVTKVLRVEDWNDVHGRTIVRCNVRFPNDGNRVVERDVSALAPATGETKMTKYLYYLRRLVEELKKQHCVACKECLGKPPSHPEIPCDCDEVRALLLDVEIYTGDTK